MVVISVPHHCYISWDILNRNIDVTAKSRKFETFKNQLKASIRNNLSSVTVQQHQRILAGSRLTETTITDNYGRPYRLCNLQKATINFVQGLAYITVV